MFFSRFLPTLIGLIIFAALSGGCARRQPPVIVSPSPTPAPTSKPAPKPTPRPAPRIYYGVATKQPVFALTFDDGPDPTWTPRILAILKQKRVPATFFMVGQMVRAHSRYARQVKAAKHPIGNHSWGHPRFPRSAHEEVERTDAIIKKVLNLKSTMFRPPYGVMNNGMVKVALARGSDVIIWNSLGADWGKHNSAASITSKVLGSARPGGIALLHDGGGNRRHTVAALPHIIDRLRARGFRFVTVPELLAMGPPIHISEVKRHAKSHFTAQKTGEGMF